VRQSNLYIIIYAAIITTVCGGLLAVASEGLKDKQQANIELEQKSNILSAVMDLPKGSNIEELYATKVKSFVVDANGKVVEGKQAKDIVVLAEYKKPADQRLLPVYEFRNETQPDKVDFVVLPVFGFGLWDNIWGFVALQEDLSTVQGVKFQHKGETPGLGARISSDDIQLRFKGKSIYDKDVLVSVTMMKGEGLDYSTEPNKVDGMSGATLTAKGVNNMIADYLKLYENYLKTLKSSVQPVQQQEPEPIEQDVAEEAEEKIESDETN
jgi:Na+-transporting NADH:ubiquinone oxidoreductase subunit C